MISRKLFALILSLAALSQPLAFGAETLSSNEIDDLVTPIALYPDPLLQAMLPASTFPDQITDAALLIQNKSDAELIKDQSWDDSVKVIASYPGVLKFMYQKLDWTNDLGKAFLAQHEDVLDGIQRLRQRAKNVGNLKSTDEQTVKQTTADGKQVIVIQPSDPEVIYVPQQTTTVVYSEPVSDASDMWAPVATFGLGVALGAALADDDDDYYYGGWGGPMWASNSSVDHWVDERHDTINHAIDHRNDRIQDRQDFRQGERPDRQDFRQDWAKNNPGQVNRENLQAGADKRKQDFQAKRTDAQGKRSDFQNQKSQAQSKFNQQRSTSSSSNTRLASLNQSGWSGSGGSSFATRTSSRGASSRSFSSSSRSSSFGSGGFRSSGGMSRGGGGFSRGGGGRGGGRR